MCKLCNTNSKSVKNNNVKSIKTGRVLLFKSIVKEYTNEYPCNTCIGIFLTMDSRLFMKDIDAYIVQKLKRCILHPVFTKKQQIRWNTLQRRKSNESLLLRHGNGHFPFTRIEKNIYQQSHISFTCAITKDFDYYIKRFKTLEEAQQFKQEVLNGNYTNTTK